jgi:hypothetical protein
VAVRVYDEIAVTVSGEHPFAPSLDNADALNLLPATTPAWGLLG